MHKVKTKSYFGREGVKHTILQILQAKLSFGVSIFSRMSTISKHGSLEKKGMCTGDCKSTKTSCGLSLPLLLSPFYKTLICLSVFSPQSPLQLPYVYPYEEFASLSRYGAIQNQIAGKSVPTILCDFEEKARLADEYCKGLMEWEYIKRLLTGYFIDA